MRTKTKATVEQFQHKIRAKIQVIQQRQAREKDT